MGVAKQRRCKWKRKKAKKNPFFPPSFNTCPMKSLYIFAFFYCINNYLSEDGYYRKECFCFVFVFAFFWVCTRCRQKNKKCNILKVFEALSITTLIALHSQSLTLGSIKRVWQKKRRKKRWGYSVQTNKAKQNLAFCVGVGVGGQLHTITENKTHFFFPTFFKTTALFLAFL